jgi:hypothetical protein
MTDNKNELAVVCPNVSEAVTVNELVDITVNGTPLNAPVLVENVNAFGNAGLTLYDTLPNPPVVLTGCTAVVTGILYVNICGATTVDTNRAGGRLIVKLNCAELDAPI